MKRLYALLPLLLVCFLQASAQTPSFTLEKVGNDIGTYIWDIKAGPDGDMWACDRNGDLFRRNHDTGKWQLVSDYPGNGSPATHIFISDEYDVWVTSQGLGIYHFDGNKWENFDSSNGPGSDKFNRVVGGADGEIWFGSDDKGLYRYKDGTWTNINTTNSPLLNDRIDDLYYADNGTLYVETYRSLQSLKNGEWNDLKLADKAGWTAFVTSISEDKDGDVWVSTSAGLFKDNAGDLKLFAGTNSKDVMHAFWDKNNILWYFVAYKQLYRYNGSAQLLENKDMPSQCWGIAEGKNNLKYLLGSLGCYVLVIDDSALKTGKISENTGRPGIYPNPAQDFLNIDSHSEIHKVEIMDCTGKPVSIVKNINQKSFTLNMTERMEIKPGIYFIKAHTQDGTFTGRFMIL